MRSLSQKLIFAFLFSVAAFAQSPHGDNFDIDCSECHEAVDWKVLPSKTKFDHSKTSFALVGQHQTINCRNCHETLKFTTNKKDCISCHTDLHQGTVGKDCSKCHTPKSWMVEDINGLHQKSRFPLVGTHLIADCQQCHPRYVDLYFEPQNITCISCHSDEYYSTQNPNHSAAGFSTDCQDCHDLTASSWSVVNVDHSFFPLVDGHSISNCFACHEEGGNFTGLSAECVACHQDDYNSTLDPNHVTAGFPTNCEQCHTIMGWEPANFDHNLTEFPLTGAHLNTNCNSCHEQGYTNTPTLCFSCHQQDYNTSQDPNHVAGSYPTECEVCHSTTAWEPAQIDHNLTGFPLTGKHIQTLCQDCHASGYTNTPTDCYACHQQEYINTTNPNHLAAAFPTTCKDCHTTNGWTPATFDHDGLYFPIYTGKHSGEWNLCSDCHQVPNNYSVFTCISCHEHYQPEMDDKHQGVQGYIYTSEACLSCHPTGEKGNAFNHANSNFPLTGAHTTVDCQQCHQSGYQGTPTECVACHQVHYNNTTNPSHTQLGLSTDCITCHTTDPDWKPALFPVHNQYFELLGAHLNISSCDNCHNGNYNNTPNTCIGCHQEDFNNATNPNHLVSGFPTTCEDCHNSSAWTPTNFSHDFYPISSQHNDVSCNECHSQPNYQPQCLSCHLEDFNEGHNPGDPTDCWGCHSTDNWDSNFNHGNTNFPLTGAHLAITCQDCHASGYQGTPTECVACHQTNYNNTTNPDHEALMLPTTCESCHTTNLGWQPAVFPIHNQFFELLGAHANITNCDDCHNGNYNNTLNTCLGCHQNDYNGTTDPPHQILNFSNDCLECHNMNGWTPANFNHTFYPISSQHNNVNCTDCHSQPNYQPQCLSCHLDDFNEEHDPGDPTDCWLCHSTNNWDSNFNHGNTNFPLTGAHLAISCQDCHSGGYQGTPTECIACHQTNYNNTTNPDHEALMLPTDCETCHSTNANWQPAVFPIHNQFFQLVGAHANITNCDDCHNGNYNNTPNTCIGCHQNDYNGANDPPHQILNFSTDCLECHNMSGWIPANFNHSFFPISNDHNNVDCNQCHSEPNYQPQCLSCHMEDFLDEHDLGDPTNCWDCHSTSDWDNSPNPKLMPRND